MTVRTVVPGRDTWDAAPGALLIDVETWPGGEPVVELLVAARPDGTHVSTGIGLDVAAAAELAETLTGFVRQAR